MNKGFALGGLGSPCCCTGISYLSCSPCNIPKANLTLSWTNPLVGPGSATLIYTTGPDAWKTVGCVNQQIYEIKCLSGVVTFEVTYFTSGVCPTGQSATCISGDVFPLGLTLDSHTCSPFSFTWNTNNCPIGQAPGYLTYTVTYP